MFITIHHDGKNHQVNVRYIVEYHEEKLGSDPRQHCTQITAEVAGEKMVFRSTKTLDQIKKEIDEALKNVPSED